MLQSIKDVSGSGNNWATGHMVYGPKYHEEILDRVRKECEHCDSLQCFFLLHSLGGGTGSGLGTYLLQILEDEFPDVYRFTTAVFPSVDDDVITSPYNSLLALDKLIDHSDCVLPLDNQSLLEICSKIAKPNSFSSSSSSSSSSSPGANLANSSKQIKSSILQNDPLQAASANKKQEKPFDKMNNIAAHLLLNLTALV